jgi:hypothetical protein
MFPAYLARPKALTLKQFSGLVFDWFNFYGTLFFAFSGLILKSPIRAYLKKLKFGNICTVRTPLLRTHSATIL